MRRAQPMGLPPQLDGPALIRATPSEEAEASSSAHSSCAPSPCIGMRSPGLTPSPVTVALAQICPRPTDMGPMQAAGMQRRFGCGSVQSNGEPQFKRRTGAAKRGGILDQSHGRGPDAGAIRRQRAGLWEGLHERFDLTGDPSSHNSSSQELESAMLVLSLNAAPARPSDTR